MSGLSARVCVYSGGAGILSKERTSGAGQMRVKKWLIIPGLLWLIFAYGYSLYVYKIPVRYWDEFAWVGRSYFFDLFIRADFDNMAWRGYESYDQPKLAEYAYGAWLYPWYLRERGVKSLDSYRQFLAKHHLYGAEAEIQEKEFNDNYEYFDYLDDYVAKYRQDALEVIYQARKLNVWLLAASAVAVYLVAGELMGVFWAVVTAIIYGFNALLINVGLVAHSEALFLLLFNAAIFFLSRYFSRDHQDICLWIFSVLAGLCMSTKLNGVILLIFLWLDGGLFWALFKKRQFYWIRLLLSTLIAGVVFVSLNPFVYSNPVQKTLDMFRWRMTAARDQAERFVDVSLRSSRQRILRIGTNFYGYKNRDYYNGNYLFDGVLAQNFFTKCYGYLLIMGAIDWGQRWLRKKKEVVVLVFCLVFLVATMSVYLVLDWDRYYVPLLLFVNLLQISGLRMVVVWLNSGLIKAVVWLRGRDGE